MKFLAERTTSLQDRLPDALIDEYKPKEDDFLPLPNNRENIFDFDDNMRLVITREDETFHVVATPAGGPVFVGENRNGIVKAVVDRVTQIGLMDIIGVADTKIEFVCGGHLHLIIERGSGKLSLESKCNSITLGSGYGEHHEQR